jgi:hypothetical protein
MNNLLSAIDRFTKYLSDDSNKRASLAEKEMLFNKQIKEDADKKLGQKMVSEYMALDNKQQVENRDAMYGKLIEANQTDLLPIISTVSGESKSELSADALTSGLKTIYGNKFINENGRVIKFADSQAMKEFENAPAEVRGKLYAHTLETLGVDPEGANATSEKDGSIRVFSYDKNVEEVSEVIVKNGKWSKGGESYTPNKFEIDAWLTEKKRLDDENLKRYEINARASNNNASDFKVTNIKNPSGQYTLINGQSEAIFATGQIGNELVFTTKKNPSEWQTFNGKSVQTGGDFVSQIKNSAIDRDNAMLKLGQSANDLTHGDGGLAYWVRDKEGKIDNKKGKKDSTYPMKNNVVVNEDVLLEVGRGLKIIKKGIDKGWEWKHRDQIPNSEKIDYDYFVKRGKTELGKTELKYLENLKEFETKEKELSDSRKKYGDLITTTTPEGKVITLNDKWKEVEQIKKEQGEAQGAAIDFEKIKNGDLTWE